MSALYFLSGVLVTSGILMTTVSDTQGWPIATVLGIIVMTVAIIIEHGE